MARPRKQTYTLKMYLDKIKDGDICNNADVQRNFVWNNEQINELIVTVLTDDYIPPIILGEEDDSQLHIADGGCRSAALKKFRYGNYKITSTIEDSVILYKRKNKDANGKIIWEDAEFDIKNKTYEKLPAELKKKFDEYQIETVIHGNCDRHKISKYIKRYNNNVPMNTNQKAFTYLYDFAGYVREISNRRFFVDFSDYTETEKIKGQVERLIVETVMCTNYLKDWKKQTKAICKYLNQRAVKEDFGKLADYLRRLENIITDDIKDIFNGKDSFLFLTLFDKFAGLGIDDRRFAEFLTEFKHNLRAERKSTSGLLFDEIDKDKGTKDKAVIMAKLDMLEKLLLEYVEGDEKEVKSAGTENFIAENLGMDIDELREDMDFYNESLDNLTTSTIKDGSRLLNKENRLSLLTMMVYSYKEDQDLDKWLAEYAQNNNMYYADQKKNFLHMKSDFERFLADKKRRSA